MIIKSLELLDYRNYENLQMDFDPGTNILYGNNAQGKTNILESIYVCATTKSHRGSRDKEMIRFGQDDAHIRMFIEKRGIEHKIDIHLKKNKTKGVAIDGLPIRKSSELMGMVNVVFFSPEDLTIIKNGPSERRHFIDMELCQLNKVYLYDISNYKKVVNQRNNLLKQSSYEASLIQNLLVSFALSHPEIAFRLFSQDKEAFRTSGNGNLLEVLFQAAGRPAAAHRPGCG